MEPDPIRIRPWHAIAITAAAVGALLWHASTILPFFADDSLISLRYSERLVEGKGLTWTDGERVEGYSNLLWVLAAAALRFLGIDLIVAARILGAVGMGGAIAALAWAHRPRGGRRSVAELLPGAVGAFALAASGPLAVWLVGGLEQPLIAGLLAWAIAAALPLTQEEGEARVLPTAIPLALLCLTRPDGALFTACVAAAVVLARGVSRRSIILGAKLAALPAAAYLGQLAFRLAYYGDWVANTARVKVAVTATRLLGGWKYVSSGYLWLAGLTLLGLLSLAAVADAKRRRRLLVIGLPLVAWSAYVCVIGGEIFPGRRHMVPAVVLLAFLGAEGLAWAVSKGGRLRMGAFAAGLGCLAALAAGQAYDPENERARKERWNLAGEPIGLTLNRAFDAAQPLMAVDPAGCLPYWSKLPSLDMLGLNDRWLAMHPPPNAGHGHFAHEFGDGNYVYSRQPDLVLFCNPWGSDRGCFRADRELLAVPGFKREYRRVTFEGKKDIPGKAPFVVHSKIWVRTESEKIGIRRSDDAVTVPGWMFATTDGSLAVWLEAEERLAGRLIDEAQGLVALELPKGDWTATMDAYADDAMLDVKKGKRVIASGPAPLTFAAPGGRIEVGIVSTGKTIVREVALRRAQAVSADD